MRLHPLQNFRKFLGGVSRRTVGGQWVGVRRRLFQAGRSDSCTHFLDVTETSFLSLRDIVFHSVTFTFGDFTVIERLVHISFPQKLKASCVSTDFCEARERELFI